uniref:hypothetical protein n=1 Tax=Alloprevotella sp. TaxID=1872471 RepID=UPI003FED9271
MEGECLGMFDEVISGMGVFGVQRYGFLLVFLSKMSLVFLSKMSIVFLFKNVHEIFFSKISINFFFNKYQYI